VFAHPENNNHSHSDEPIVPQSAFLNAAQLLNGLMNAIDTPEIIAEIEICRSALLTEAAGFSAALAARMRAATPAVPRAFGHGLGLFTPRDPRLSLATTDQIIGEIVRRGACRAVLLDLVARGKITGVRIDQ